MSDDRHANEVAEAGMLVVYSTLASEVMVRQAIIMAFREGVLIGRARVGASPTPEVPMPMPERDG